MKILIFDFRRVREKLVHPLEKDNFGNTMNLVKEFRRSAAGQKIKSTEIRTPQVCQNTADYLIQILFKHGMTSTTYDFIFDRLRSVRQDLSIQGYPGDQSVQVYQICVRFHLLALYHFGSALGSSRFNMNFNFQQLLECLKELLKLYNQNWHVQDQQQMEVIAVYLILNLGDQSAIAWILNLPIQIRNQCLIKSAIEMNWCHLQRNHVRFFRHFRQVPLILKLATFWSIPWICDQALLVMSTAYNQTTFPLSQLCQSLPLSPDTVQDLCLRHGILQNANGDLQMSKKDFKQDESSSQSWFQVG